MARDYFLTVSSSPGTLVGSGSGKDNQQQLYSHIVQFVLIRIISQFSYNIQLISIFFQSRFSHIELYVSLTTGHFYWSLYVNYLIVPTPT